MYLPSCGDAADTGSALGSSAKTHEHSNFIVILFDVFFKVVTNNNAMNTGYLLHLY